MNEITISTYDSELLHAIAKLKIDNLEFKHLLLDDATSPENLIAYIGLASALISLLAAILPLISKSNSKRKTTIYIRTTEVTSDLRNLITNHKEQVTIEVIQIVKK